MSVKMDESNVACVKHTQDFQVSHNNPLHSSVSWHKEQDRIPVMRAQWFIDGTWLPLEEEESDLIEQEHLTRFRGQQMQDNFESDVVARTVDSKDGEFQEMLGKSYMNGIKCTIMTD